MGNNASSLDAIVERAFSGTDGKLPGASEQTLQGYPRGTPLGILSFEAASVLQKVLDLWHALQPSEIERMRPALQAEGLLKLVSEDDAVRWDLAGQERREDLKRVMDAVSILGQKSSNPHLQQLRTRFAALQKADVDLSPGNLAPKHVEAVLSYAQGMVSTTRDLYAEMGLLDNMRSSYLRLNLAEQPPASPSSAAPSASPGSSATSGSSSPLASASAPPSKAPTSLSKTQSSNGRSALRVPKLLKALVASREGRPGSPAGAGGSSFNDSAKVRGNDRSTNQMKLVQKLRSMSLWVEDSDRAAQILVLLVYMLQLRIREVFGPPHAGPGVARPDSEGPRDQGTGTLGDAGLALHYAYLIQAISRMVDRPMLVLRNAREDLYQKIPRHLQRLLKVRLKGKGQRFELDVAADMRRTLESLLKWMLPMAGATVVWHREHSFGQQFLRKSNILRVQTLFAANQTSAEVALLELLVGLCYIIRPMGHSSVQLEDQPKWKEWVASGGLLPPRCAGEIIIHQKQPVAGSSQSPPPPLALHLLTPSLGNADVLMEEDKIADVAPDEGCVVDENDMMPRMLQASLPRADVKPEPVFA
eukprot:TRINITY_DN38656_c0_g1_i1.p1 TRINITY_DN38656_c0_g1~~TRINITY_DN38656_c0_g1_i1.p1  ORF type:complete len:588 (+),score=119.90 TRINITY_DN38656_c0_g1_i1:1468-3231(+)